MDETDTTFGGGPWYWLGFPHDTVVKNTPAMQEIHARALVRRSLGGGNGKPFQYPCLGNPMHRGAWWATVHEVVKELDKT